MELAHLAKRMQTLSKTLQAGVDEAQRSTAEQILIDLAKKTPFDTGNARINWQVVLNNRPEYAIWNPAYRPPISPRGGYQGASAGADAVLNGLPVIASFNGNKHDSIHITNNAAYIVDLNKGKSPQAPAGYVQSIIASAVRSLQSFGVFDIGRKSI